MVLYAVLLLERRNHILAMYQASNLTPASYYCSITKNENSIIITYLYDTDADPNSATKSISKYSYTVEDDKLTLQGEYLLLSYPSDQTMPVFKRF